MGSEIKVAKLPMSHCRKLLVYINCPYRKPTQVVEERILKVSE